MGVPEICDGNVVYTPADPSGDCHLTTLTATENDTYAPEEGYDGFSSVTVNVQPALESLTATANGSYTTTDYGFASPVVVAIPEYDGTVVVA